MARWSLQDTLTAETVEAQSEGVPASLAHAIAEVETHHNTYAIGDHGTSFGDYQLHRGGMLGSLTPEQAFNPYTNAKVALHSLASTIQRYPGVHDPGALAALSQRPADPHGYAVKVDQAMQTGPAGSSNSGAQSTELASFHIPDLTGPLNWTYDHSLGWVLHGAGDAASGVSGAVAAPFVAIYNLFRGVWDFFTSAKTWIRIALFVGGGVLIVVGVKAALGSSSMPVPVPVP